MEAIGAIRQAINGMGRWRLSRQLYFLGPGFLISVGYMDPGNWATDLAAGSSYGYRLLWVVLMANLIAILLQYLSAKLGLVTGRSLAEHCRLHYRRPVRIALWILAELAMMATDLAEVLGVAIGLHLLFGIPILWGAILGAGGAFLILWLSRLGYRAVEFAIIGLVAIIGICYVIEILLARPAFGPIVAGTLIPNSAVLEPEGALIAAGILGATVMPHNVYLHSAIVRRDWQGESQTSALRYTLIDTVVSLNAAFFVNAAILIMGAAVFHQAGLRIESLEEAYRTLEPLLGSLASGAFGIALIASGLSSTTTGTLAGQEILTGFTGLRINVWLRRLITISPALIIIALGVDTLQALILSQVVLSLQLPFASIPLVLFTDNRRILGPHANATLTRLIAWLAVLMVVGLNLLLLYLVFTGQAAAV